MHPELHALWTWGSVGSELAKEARVARDGPLNMGTGGLGPACAAGAQMALLSQIEAGDF